jgi:predicted acylesterase/phospholipase RssA
MQSQSTTGLRVKIKEHSMCMAEPAEQPPIGLVLTGGGAKGAYQVGCLKALRHAGYTNFGAISGTSVGAMNAVLMAAGKLDAAEESWTNLRCRDIIGLKPHKILLLPLWLIAGLISEFSLAKVFRIPGSLLMPLHRALVGKVSDAEDLPPWTWLTIALLGVLMFLDDWSRRVFLGWIFTTNKPLASRLDSLVSEADVSALRQSKVPVYATLSRFQPGAGWFPQYARLDKLNREQIVDTLVQSAGFPGVFPAPGYFGRHVVDGGWTDNIPAAPLLFDPAARVDMIFVIKVDRTASRPSRLKRLITATGAKLWGKVSARPASGQDSLTEWARARWEASIAHAPTQEAARTLDPSSQTAATNPATHESLPRMVTVVPSHPLGSVLTGTLWFSRAKARRLIDQGEKDMNAVLAELNQPRPSGDPFRPDVAAVAEAGLGSPSTATA